MNDTSFATQTHVYFKKISRISLREKSWKYLIFAFIISFVVAIFVGPDMFRSFEQTNTAYFALTSACIWIGIFNSVQSVCKEHEIIRAEYRQGMRISSYVVAHVLWQALLCLAQTIVIFVVCIIWMKFQNYGSSSLFISVYVANFLTIYLLALGAAVLGLMISSISGTPTTAMTVMPFILIVQLVLSGVLFQLKGAGEILSYFTFSRWGMCAFGSEANLNAIPTKVVNLLTQRFGPQMVAQMGGVPNALTTKLYDHTTLNLLGAWGGCLALTALNIAISIIALKLKNRDS